MDVQSAAEATTSVAHSVRALEISNDAAKTEGKAAVRLIEGAGPAQGNVDPSKGANVDIHA